MKKLSIVMALVLLVGLCVVPAYAADETKAKELIDLGLMSSLEVERETTRAEMMTLYVRFLGKETEAVSQKNVHPFTDVPDWASNYIGWLFANGITKGIGNNLSGSANLGTAKEYLNLLLICPPPRFVFQ